VMTYLKLKKESAKRQIFELYSKGKIQPGAKLDWSSCIDGDSRKKAPENGVLNIKISEGEKTVYRYMSKYENVPIREGQQYNRQNIKNNLNHYLDKLKTGDGSHTPTISRINHLRNAITANMVGVICHLQKYYKGFIIMEDLKKGDIDKHFSQSNENISRRLEKALYNKLQSIGLVPPHIKDIISLRESLREEQKSGNQSGRNTKKEDAKNQIREWILDKNGRVKNEYKGMEGYARFAEKHFAGDMSKAFINTSSVLSKELFKELGWQHRWSSQIGVIVFVDETDTSKTCPYCENKDIQSNDVKYRQKRFICGDTACCGFDTYHFTSEEERVEDYEPHVNNNINKNKFDFLKDINDPDKVAAYNIAKKITDPEKIGKMNQDF